MESLHAAPLALGEWSAKLEELARSAERAGDDASLQVRMDLALEAISLLWLGWSPRVIARSARASIALREPLLVADPGELDRTLISSRSARQAALKHLEDLPRPTAQLAPVLIDDDGDAAPVPAGWECTAGPGAGSAAPKPQRRRQRPVPSGEVPDGWIGVEGVADRLHLSRSAVQRWAREGVIPQSQMMHSRGRWWFDPAVEPPKPQARKPVPAPAGCLLASQVCEMLGIDRATLARWRRGGLIPAAACRPHGRTFAFDVDLIEALRNKLHPEATTADWTV